MKAVLISEQAALTARWSEAFPVGKVTGSLKQALRIPKKQDPLYWLDLSSLPQGDWLDGGRYAQCSQQGLLSSQPSPPRRRPLSLFESARWGTAIWARLLSVLQEIALVLAHEGFWMPKEMIQRITQLTRRLGARKFNPIKTRTS